MVASVIACRTPPSDDAPERAVSDTTQPPAASAVVATREQVATTSDVATSAFSGAPLVRREEGVTFDVSHDDIRASPVAMQQAYLIDLVARQANLDAARREHVRALVEKSEWLSFGNPKVSKPAMTKAECRQRRSSGNWHP